MSREINRRESNTKMLDTLRKSWIVLLLLVMVALHASIIGVVRYKAAQVRTTASCEVDLGQYWIPTSDQSDLHLHLFAVVPASLRLQSRKAFELRENEIRQSIEELLRISDPNFAQDPKLSKLKQSVFDVLAQTVGETMVDRVLITEFGKDDTRPVAYRGFDRSMMANNPKESESNERSSKLIASQSDLANGTESATMDAKSTETDSSTADDISFD